MLIYRSIITRLRASHILKLVYMLCAALLFVPAVAGCSPQSMAQSATATASAKVSPTASKTASEATPTEIAAPAGTQSPGADATEGPLPTPTGAPPDPISRLNVFKFVIAPQVLVKRDMLQLIPDSTLEGIMTISEPAEAITQETNSVIEILAYDTQYRDWYIPWDSDIITGTASPLPGANRADGYNGGDLLHNGHPIFVARTTTLDGKAHLYLWSWDSNTKKATPIKMVPAAGKPEQLSFDADLDVRVADLNDDGVYEVVADNVSGVLTWKWDGSKFVPAGPEVQNPPATCPNPHPTPGCPANSRQ